ncbi:MAG: hypothetical protein IPK53_17645 [bacterium]|nr:hypothetical protein [bacterium]
MIGLLYEVFYQQKTPPESPDKLLTAIVAKWREWRGWMIIDNLQALLNDEQRPRDPDCARRSQRRAYEFITRTRCRAIGR